MPSVADFCSQYFMQISVFVPELNITLFWIVKCYDISKDFCPNRFTLKGKVDKIRQLTVTITKGNYCLPWYDFGFSIEIRINSIFLSVVEFPMYISLLNPE